MERITAAEFAAIALAFGVQPQDYWRVDMAYQSHSFPMDQPPGIIAINVRSLLVNAGIVLPGPV